MSNVIPFQAKELAVKTEGDQLSFSEQHIAVIRQSYASDLNDVEFATFINMAKRRGLDPFRGHVHAVKRGGRLVFQTGIDGFRNLAGRTGEYAGSDEPVYEMYNGTPKRPEKAAVTVWRIVRGQRVAFTGVAYWDEFYPGEGGQGQMWRKMPRNQLAKCAEAQALRKGFPEQVDGLYIPEEMDQAQREAGVIPSKAAEVASQVDTKPEPREVQSEQSANPECCGGRMMVSKFPNRETGAFDWYCPKCRGTRARS